MMVMTYKSMNSMINTTARLTTAIFIHLLEYGTEAIIRPLRGS